MYILSVCFERERLLGGNERTDPTQAYFVSGLPYFFLMAAIQGGTIRLAMALYLSSQALKSKPGSAVLASVRWR